MFSKAFVKQSFVTHNHPESEILQKSLYCAEVATRITKRLYVYVLIKVSTMYLASPSKKHLIKKSKLVWLAATLHVSDAFSWRGPSLFAFRG